MKLTNLLVGSLALVCVTGAAQAQITGSAHDFSSWTSASGQICKPCHTPHFSQVNDAPLWNHNPSVATSFTMFEGVAGAATQADFDTRSMLCLSCHDGVTALDSFGGAQNPSGNTIAARARIGTDLSDDHPIGSAAIYPLTDPLVPSTRFNPQNASHQVPSAWGTLRLRAWVNPVGGATEYVVGCSTCHTVHNTGNFGHMVRFSNASSHLCLACHIK